MNCGVEISSVNLSGQTVYVTYLPLSGGSIDLGVQVMPFSYYSDYYYGLYEVYSPTYNTTYDIEVPDYTSPTPTPTNTSTPTVTPTNTPTNTVTPSITPTNTVTPSITPTNTVTPTVTPTPTVTLGLTPTATSTPPPTATPTPTPTPPVYYAYIFPEPQDSTSASNLGEYMFDNGATNFFGFSNSGVPPISGYDTDLTIYANYSGFTTAGFGNYIVPVSTFSSTIRQYSGNGTDSFGCSQTQYTFGTIEIPLSSVNDSVIYFYSIWIPLNGVNNNMNNMTVDISYGSACNPSIVGSIPVPSLSEINVTIPPGSAIPSGVYRVLWMPVSGLQPVDSTLTSPLYFKGNSKI